MSQLILYSLVGGLFSLLGGLVLIWRADIVKRYTLPLMTFAAGAFLAASFLDLLPEALELTDEPQSLMYALVAGFLFFFTLERVLMRYFHTHESTNHQHADHTESLPVLIIVGDSIHNFLDGIVIGLAYLASPSLGLITAIAVAAHEIPQEIGDFSILLNQGWTKSKVIVINILQSLLTVIGALFAYSLGQQLESSLPYFLASAAGIFIYIGASDIIPEIHHLAGHKHLYRVLAILISSVVLIGALIRFAHGN